MVVSTEGEDQRLEEEMILITKPTKSFCISYNSQLIENLNLFAIRRDSKPNEYGDLL